jgi:hypothetical protein
MFDLKGYVLDRAVENRQQDARDPKEYNASTWDKIVGGLVGADVEKAVDDNTKLLEQQDIEDRFKNQFVLQGLEMPENATAAQLSKILKKDKRATTLQEQSDAYYSLVAKEERRRRDEIRADEMSIRADDYALRRDQMMLEDQRYNERLEREFQQRRKESLMAMMQGLASLGAAFAA